MKLPASFVLTRRFALSGNAMEFVPPNRQHLHFASLAVTKIIFLKAGSAFTTTIYLDFAGATTSTDIQLSLRDNSATSGDMNNITSGTGSVPVFSFASAGHTFGGTSRRLIISTPRMGRYSMCLRVIDNSGNYSMFEMDWNIVA